MIAARGHQRSFADGFITEEVGDSSEDFSSEKGGAEYEPPAPGASPLLRTGRNSFQEAAYIAQNHADEVGFCVHAGDLHSDLIGMFGASGDAIHRQRERSDRFGVLVRNLKESGRAPSFVRGDCAL